MKNIFKISILASLMLVGVSCSEFADKYTVDPNNTTEVAPEVLLTSSLQSVASVVGRPTELLYTQQMSETQYTEASRYQDINFDFNGWYTGPLANLEQIIELNTDEATKEDAAVSGSNANQIAVARILKAYFFSFMTDRWGPLPYTQALQGRENFRPGYDDQETIYMSLFTELKEAVNQMDGGAGVKGDYIFGGDMDMWAKFANTLRANMALRLSEVNASLAESEFADAVADGVISSVDENMMYPYLAESNNENPWFSRFRTRTDYAISDVLVNKMRFPFGSSMAEGTVELQDPRLAVYADPAPNYGYVVGMPYGIEAAGDIPNDEISFPGFPAVRGQDAPLPIFTYAQMLFDQAEAAYYGWIDGDAGMLYEEAIKASMQQWGVYDEDTFAAFMARPEVAWDENNALELIGYQKWVALYLQGVESWSEWRRLGYPELTPAPDPLNESGEIPVRQAYPTSERDLNGPNYDAGVQMLGGEDGLDTPLWWDK